MEENKYEAALERAKSAIKECGDNVGRIKMIESIFSDELWESEEEQTRKQLLDFVQRNTLASYSDRDKWVAYLEKLKDIDKRLEVQYKRGYDDGYLEGIGNAKKELEKQGEQSKEVTYTHEVETGNGNIKALVMEKVQLPKFKVGDKVRMKEFESFPHICTVEDVDSDVYYCDFTNFDIDDQDGWELVKEPKFKVGN